MNDKLLKDWSDDDFRILEHGILCANHRMADTGLFSDEGLIKILDEHPEEAMSINLMGTDTKKFEWREGQRNGTSSADLIELVRQGHFWLNLRSVQKHHSSLGDLIDRVYGELEASSPGFTAQARTGNLIISSPQAIVYYHIDTKVNMLWHMRGRKRVYVYPPFDERFVSNKVIELCASGAFTDEVPYDIEFDKYALKFDAQPGQLITWPQMTPHRVENLEGLNVSLSTEHSNPRAVRRFNSHLANHMLRQSIGRFCTSTSPDGISARIKNNLVRVARKWNKLTKKQEKKAYTYPISFKVDPSSPNGVVHLDIPEEELIAPHMRQQM